MPSEIGWSLGKRKGGSFEILFPDEAAHFKVYDVDAGIYRILIFHCAEDDSETKLFEFEETPEINMERDLQELAEFCTDESLFETVPHPTGYLIETYLTPDLQMNIFIGHQAILFPN